MFSVAELSRKNTKYTNRKHIYHPNFFYHIGITSFDLFRMTSKAYTSLVIP